jgi:geranylgeranyl pyrophosphate synthase
MAIARKTDSSSAITYLQPIQTDLRLVEEILASKMISSVHTVTDVTGHVLEAGGKRLRPSLVLLSARVFDTDLIIGRAAEIAACTEMLHMATLMHDDVIDEAGRRRGRATANSHWGNQISVLSGDYILA